MKKLIPAIVVLLIIFTAVNVYAAFSDVPPGASYTDALDRVSALGIMSGTGTGLYKPNNILSREQFAKIVVIASGFENEAMKLKEEPLFTDVQKGSWSNGYINFAKKQELISGMLDGKFYPREDITFGQACTLLIKALGYANDEVPGKWPDNYIQKCKNLGITKDVNLKNADGLPRWAAAVMIDKFWITKVKNNSFSDLESIFGGSLGIYSECTVLGNSSTSDTLTSNQVLTDKGILNVADPKMQLELGYKYKLIIDGDLIVKECGKSNSTMSLTIDSIDGNKITYLSDNKPQSMILSEKNTYYYQGTKLTFDAMKNTLHKGLNAILAYNKDRTDYEYVIFLEPSDYNAGQYSEYIVLGNSKTSESLSSDQILTDKGIVTFSLTGVNLEIGNKYGLVVKDDNVIKVVQTLKVTKSFTITNSLDNVVYYKENNESKSMVLPEKTIYYYGGVKQNYAGVGMLMRPNSSIIFAYNKNMTGFEYAIVFDPVYSKPEIALNFSGSGKLGNIDFSGNPTIIRNGVMKNASDIKNKDVVYQVTDIWGQNKYILVIDNKVEGLIDEISPSILSPKTVKVKGNAIAYEFSRYADFNHIKFFKQDDFVKILLGYDGKVVDIYNYND